MVGNPPPRDYINMVRSGIICNCPVTPEEVNNANTMFGPDIASLKGKTTGKTSDPVVTEYVEIPQEILDLSNKVTLEADVIFANGLGFSVSTSRRIKFTTLEYIHKFSK